MYLFRPILAGLDAKYNLSASVIDPYFGLNAVSKALNESNLSEFVGYIMIALLIGFALNIVLVL